MKILHVNDYREGGGAEVVIARTIELQRERGHEVELFTIDDVPGHRRTFRSYTRNTRARRALEEWIDAFQPDAVHLHNFYHELSPECLTCLDAASRPAGCRVIMTAHDYHLHCPSAGGFTILDDRLIPLDPSERVSAGPLSRHVWDYRGFRYNYVKGLQHFYSYRVKRRHLIPDVVACPSFVLMEALGRDGLPVVHLPYPTPPFAPTQERPDELTIVFAGRLEREKGVAECLEIWPRDFDARLRIVGDGAERGRCEQIASDRGLNVEFLGQLPHEQAKRAISRAHVLLLPTRCIEVSPLSVHEALAAGTSILVPDHGGCNEIVEESGVGFRFVLDDEQSLGAALTAVRASFERGELNSFDLHDYFEARSEAKYIEWLEQIYADPTAAIEDGAVESDTLLR